MTPEQRDLLSEAHCRDTACFNWDPDVEGGCTRCDEDIDAIAPAFDQMLDEARKEGEPS